MSKNLPEVGDKVIFKGRVLHVTAVEAIVAKIEDVDARRARERAVVRFKELRAEQVELESDEIARHTEIAKEIAKLDAEVSQALFKLGLRKDLLVWWENEECWFSPGRLLSDEQIAEFKFTHKRKPGQGSEEKAVWLDLKGDL